MLPYLSSSDVPEKRCHHGITRRLVPRAPILLGEVGSGRGGGRRQGGHDSLTHLPAAHAGRSFKSTDECPSPPPI